jgi:hypothetical protein
MLTDYSCFFADSSQMLAGNAEYMENFVGEERIIMSDCVWTY